MENEEKLCDLTFLRSFTANDLTRMNRYIGMFLDNAPKLLQQIENGRIAGDWQTVKIAAHSLKPQLNYMGIKKLQDVITNIEFFAGAGTNFDQIHSLSQTLQTVCAEAMIELKTYL